MLAWASMGWYYWGPRRGGSRGGVLKRPAAKGGGVISQRLHAPPGAFLGILHDHPQGLEPIPD